jgi:hypothetical protein
MTKFSTTACYLIKVLLRQAKIRGSSGLIEKYCISDLPCSDSWTTLTTPWSLSCPCTSPLIDYWMGITWFLPSNRSVLSFKSTRRREARSLSLPLDSTCVPSCSLLYFPSLTFNKLHLYPHVLQWILPCGTQRIWKPSDHRLYPTANATPHQGLPQIPLRTFANAFFKWI